ncbi:unnamed protein product [Closterium sp. NIES-64]|nr:unnamed protein product [Closterium sp. NIES-64]
MAESNAWLAAVSACYSAAGIVPYCYDDAGRLFFLLHTEGCGHCPPRAIAPAGNQASASGRTPGSPRAIPSACDASKQNKDEEENRQESRNPSDQPQEIVVKQEPDQENEEEQKQASANPSDQSQEIVVKQEPDQEYEEEQKQASANPSDQSQEIVVKQEPDQEYEEEQKQASANPSDQSRETAAESGAAKRKRLNDQLRMELAQEDPRSRKKRLEALKAEHRLRESARKREEKRMQDQEREGERMRESQNPSDQSQETVAEGGAAERKRFIELARMQLAQEDPQMRKKRLEAVKAEHRLREKGRKRQEKRRRKMQKSGVFLLDFGGKKEAADNNSPARTAAREYVEEYEAGYYNLKGATWEKRIADVAAALADQSEAFYSGNSGHVFFLCHEDRLKDPEQGGASVTDNSVTINSVTNDSVTKTNGANGTAGGAVTVKKKTASGTTPAVPASVVTRLNARWVDASKVVDHLLNKKRLKPALHYRLSPSGPSGGVLKLVACIARLQEIGNARVDPPVDPPVNPPAPSDAPRAPPCNDTDSRAGLGLRVRSFDAASDKEAPQTHESRVAC